MLHHVKHVLTGHTYRELEAESVAYVVARHFSEWISSPNCNAPHGAGRSHYGTPGAYKKYMQEIIKTIE
jgi:hypothetical protein